MSHDPSSTRALLLRRHELPGEAAPLFHDEPLHSVRGEGVRLYDGDGRICLDAHKNVPHVGLYLADEVQPGCGRMGDHLWDNRQA